MVDKDNEGPKEIKSVDELFAYLNELEFYTNHFFEGVRLAKEGFLSEAEMMFRKSLEGHESSGVWTNLGKIYSIKAKQAYEKAESILKKQFAEIAEDYDGELPDEYFTEPEEIDELHDLAFVQFKQFKFDVSQLTYLRILRIDRLDIKAWDGLSRCLQLTGRFEDAKNALLIVKGLQLEKNDHYESMARDAKLESLAPQPNQGSFELLLRWVGNSGEFILKIMKGLHTIHGRELRIETVVEQAEVQGMPSDLAERTIEKLQGEGMIYSPKSGIVIGTFL